MNKKIKKLVSTLVLGLTLVGVFGSNASASTKVETFNTGSFNFSLGANSGTDKSSAVKKTDSIQYGAASVHGGDIMGGDYVKVWIVNFWNTQYSYQSSWITSSYPSTYNMDYMKTGVYGDNYYLKAEQQGAQTAKINGIWEP